MRKNHSTNPWLEERFNGNESYLWFKARKMMILSKPSASALDLVDENSERISLKLVSQDEQLESQQRSLRWTENMGNSVRTMIDLIVTKWKPRYTNQNQLSLRQLHESLIPTPLDSIKRKFGKRISNI